MAARKPMDEKTIDGFVIINPAGDKPIMVDTFAQARMMAIGNFCEKATRAGWGNKHWATWESCGYKVCRARLIVEITESE